MGLVIAVVEVAEAEEEDRGVRGRRRAETPPRRERLARRELRRKKVKMCEGKRKEISTKVAVNKKNETLGEQI